MQVLDQVGVVNEENVENMVLGVAREVSNDLSSIFERTNHDDIKDAGVAIFLLTLSCFFKIIDFFKLFMFYFFKKKFL